MKILIQKIITPTETREVTHMYSETGHFERNGLNEGWHIELGTGASVDDYTEHTGLCDHEVPDSLPDIIVPEDEEGDEEAEVEDYQRALEALGVEIDKDGDGDEEEPTDE